MILKADIVKATKIAALQKELEQFSEKPKLQIIVVGEHSASKVYVRNKVNLAQEIGIEVELVTYPETVTEAEILKAINDANNDESVTGLFVQLPLPKHINEQKVIKAIKPEKDVDGFTLENIGKLFIGDESGLFPCTVEGILDILDYYQIPVQGKNVTMVGRSNIVGKPLTLRMINLGATVTTCNSQTKDLATVIANTDILVTAIGRAKFFDESYFTNNPNLVIIDVGMNRDSAGKLCGDVDFEQVKSQVAAITPVPGGVGVMTVVKVVENVIKAYRIQKGE